MINADKFFELAQLAEASYADFSDPGVSPKDALIDDGKGFSSKQADLFLADWQIVNGAHRPNTASGFSSTLFQNTDGGYVFAIRGTEGILSDDLWQEDIANIATDGLALDQIVDLYNEWQRIVAPAGQSYQVAKLVDLVSGGSPTTVLLDMPSGIYKTIEFSDSSIAYPAGSPYATGLGLAAEIASKGLTVTGHSLGGHLADAFTRLFPEVGADAFTVNGAGFATGAIPGLGGAAQINIANLFGMLGGATGFVSTDIFNLYGDRYPEFVAQDGKLGLQQQGEHEAIYIEHVDALASAFGHGGKGMTDSLAVYDLFIELDGSLQTADPKAALAKLKPQFEAASNDDGQFEGLSPKPNASLETIVNALADLFNTGVKIGDAQTDDRQALYLALNAIQGNLTYQQSKGLLTVQPLAEFSGATLASKAQAATPESLAYRYALAGLNSFALTGDASIYAGHNASGELDLYDPATGTGVLTDQYLKDRAAMLSWKMQFDTGTRDSDDPLGPIPDKPYSDDWDSWSISGDWDFIDQTSGIKLTIDGVDLTTTVNHQVVFGSQNADALSGDTLQDNLYGGAGADTLAGFGGNDTLEGGSGYDTYVVNPGDGYDTVLDSDGSGVIKFGSLAAQGSTGVATGKWQHTDGSDTWIDQQNGITYSKSVVSGETRLLIHKGDTNVLVKGWAEGELGIELGVGAPPVSPATTDQLTGTAAADYLNSTAAAARLVEGGIGKDFIFGSAAADQLDGGDDSDWIVGGSGADRIQGGTGADYIVGLGANATIEAGDGNDIIDARLTATASTQSSPISSATTWADLSQYFSLVVTAPFSPDGSDTATSVWGGISSGTYSGASSQGGGWTYQFTFTEVGGSMSIQSRYFHATLTGASGVDSGLTFSLGDQPGIPGAGITAFGEAGEDLLNGADGADFLFGGIERDRLWGNGGEDVLAGGDGDDVLSGDDEDPSGQKHGADYLDGGAGVDYVWGDGGADLIFGQAGADRLEGDDTGLVGSAHGADLMYGGLDGDFMWGDGAADSLYGEDGDDYLQGDNSAVAGEFHGNDLLDGGAGNDTLIGDGGADILIGGSGQDVLRGDEPGNAPLAAVFHGGDTLDGGDDNDLLWGDGGDDVLLGGAGVDGMDGGDGNDTLDGGADADEIYGGQGNDTIIGGGGGGMDYMNGESGDDRYVLASGDGALVGGLADTIDDSEGNNTIEFASGIVAADISATWVSGTTDVVLKYGATDYVYVRNALGGGIATVDFAGSEQKSMGALLREILLANAGSVGNASNNLLYSGELGKLLDGQGGNDTLVGGAGNEAIYGGAGNDYLLGGPGSDTLEGSIGSDTYLFNLGDGADTIYETNGSYPTYIDVLKFGAGINPDDVMAVRVLGNLELQHVNGSDKVVIASWFDSYNGNGYFQLDKVEFADGTQWTQGYLTGLFPTLEGTNGNDTLNGSNSNDTLIGRSGNDTLSGGKGNDALMGSDGSDTYKFNLGDGLDTIYEAYGYSYFDVLEFGVGINPSDITAARVGNNLELKHINGTDKVVIDRWFMAKNGYYQLDQVRFAGGTQWTQAQLTDSYMTVEGTSGNDSLTGGEYGETLIGLGGDDILNGAGGDDTLLGGSGNDTLNGSIGNDILHGGTGNDILNGKHGSDTYLFNLGDGVDTIKIEYVNNGANYTNVLKFSDGINPGDITAARVGKNLELQHANGTDKVIVDNWYNSIGEQLDWVEFANGTQWTQAQLTTPFMTFDGTAGNDTLNGGEFSETLKGLAGDDTLNGLLGDDILLGGPGNDALNGGAGNDTYEFGLGDGMDIIKEVDGLSSEDVLKFSTGINPGDISVTRVGHNLQLKHVNGTDKVDIEGWFLLSNGGYQLDRVYFVDGTQWTQTQLTTPFLTIEGTGGNDTLTGGQYGETLKGLAGDDTLNGDGGSDTLVGGAGNDTLNGSSGPTTYEFNLGDGVDAINEAWGFNTTDVIKFGASISSGYMTVLRNGMDLELKHASGADKIIINDWFLQASGYSQVDRVEFSDGTEWTQTQLTDPYLTLGGTVENDTLNGGGFGETMNGLLGDDVLNGDGGNDTLVGGAGNDTLNGGDGNDTYVFNLGDGLDTISETYVFSATDVLKFGAGIAEADIAVWRDDVDLVFAHANNQDKVTVKNWFVSSTYQIERIEFADGRGFALDALMLGTAEVDNITATSTSNIIMGYEGNDNLSGGDGGDWLDGGGGIDIIRGDAGDDMLVGGEGNDVYIFGRGSGQDTVNSYDTGAGKLDTVQFDATVVPSEILISRLGNDLLLTVNGAGDTLTIQRYMDNEGASPYTVEQIKFQDGTTWDVAMVKAILSNRAPVLSTALPDQTAPQGGAFSYAFASNAFTDSDAGDTLTYSATLADGSALPSWLAFNAATRTFSGTPSTLGAISVRVTAKDSGNLTVSDTFDITVSVQNLTLNGTSGVDTLNSGAGNDTLNGLAGNDTLNGNAGNDQLDGGTGNDTLRGGTGDDTYIVDSATDVITENLNEGLDNVQASVTTTLAANVENLTLTGTTAINGTGNTLNNVITGNSAINTLSGGAGNDRLDGKGGADKLLGGAGNDTYVVDISTDAITENASEGTDTVESSVTLTLANNVENLVLTGTAAINGTGNTLANVLTGNSANNTLSGGTGADTMIGGVGNDTYVVDNASDTITENANEGTDLVQASVTHTLANNVENLTLTGTAVINGTGNALDNVLTGNSKNNTLTGGAGNDRLNGGTGNDTMLGGTGNDTYVVNVTTDIVTENANEGIDTVESSVTLTLGNNVENLTLTGTSALSGTGNTLDNILTGNSGANTLTGNAGNDRLDGGTGNDTMRGGVGDDTYVVNVSTDIVTENASEGIDTVESSVTLTLGNNVENLTLTGSSAVNGTGNTLNNVLKGNSGVNSLTGAAGNDTLEGLGGADTLTGGTGNDTYRLGRGYAADTVVENDATAGNTDIAQFLTGVTADQIWFQKVGNNLETSIIGTSDKLVVKDWYLGNAYHVEQFKTTDDAKTLLDSNVANLVNAMASFAPPAAGQTTLPSNYQTALAPVIAANWQ